MAAIYNEIEPFACAWLEALIGSGAITDGTVERRSIADLGADELRGFARAHFFAGIGGWDYALELAGWPDDVPVWTGSCPCQPFSVAGNRRGESDPRHLWPDFRRLIAECRPAIIFGEQVASKAGREWFAAVRADLEALGYAAGGGGFVRCEHVHASRTPATFLGCLLRPPAIPRARAATQSERRCADPGTI